MFKYIWLVKYILLGMALIFSLLGFSYVSICFVLFSFIFVLITGK